MRTRSLSVAVVAVAAVAWWPSQREPAPISDDASWALDDRELPASTSDDDPLGGATKSLAAESSTSAPSTPLVRQRDRLRNTASRLVARREAAVASGVPEPTVRALDAHLARIEKQLVMLDTTLAMRRRRRNGE